VCFLLASSSFALTSASAFVYRANGKIVGYNPDYDWAFTSRQFGGSWVLRIDSSVVHFRAHWLEMNIQEEIPGTIDEFTLVFTSVSSVEVDGSICIITGSMTLCKKGWNTQTGKREFSTSAFQSTVTVNTQLILINFIESLFPLEWEITGQTHSVHY